ncbi:hypothetical protein GCM10011344_42800 [Dokdonia pacifica]|uniref:Uncharacterized protein n=1 Tax=Dokdonia pacifica TaxID=1627892 RepID=A0A239AHQ8_9FLAO|nr:hypothetical protein [Dokdonia pacifica]GGG37418.1 hypothetical protein GCM10011344_42800 [Dokdonia pacifica]SNR95080.1 hypothetical protein SAMN06265376_104444 [Dokdonia pacifica]
MGLHTIFKVKSRDILREPIYLGKDQNGNNIVHEYHGLAKVFPEAAWTLRAISGRGGKDLNEIKEYSDNELENEYAYSEMLTYDEFIDEMKKLKDASIHSINKAIDAYENETNVKLVLTESNAIQVSKSLKILVKHDLINEIPDLFLADHGLPNDARDFISKNIQEFENNQQVLMQMEKRLDNIQEDLKGQNLESVVCQKASEGNNHAYSIKVDVPKCD